MMEQQALEAIRMLTQRLQAQPGSALADGQTLMRAALAGYFAGSGVPSDEAVARMEAMMPMVGPVPANPMYQGIPWMVPGPVSGAPYYADETVTSLGQ